MTKRSRPDLWGASLERAAPTWKIEMHKDAFDSALRQ